MPFDGTAALEPAAGARVIIARAFTPNPVELIAPAAVSVARILQEAVNAGHLTLADLPYTQVWLDGELQEDRHASLDAVPASGSWVNLCVLPAGPAVPALKALEAILHTAMIALSHVVGAHLAASLTLKGLLKLGAQTLLLSGAKAILNKLFHPKPASQTQTYSLDGQANQQRYRQMMPLVLATQNANARVTFDLAASGYTSVVGNDVYLTAIYGIHYGPCEVSDLRIGETDESAYPAGDIQLEYFLTPGPRNSALYPMLVVQDTFQDELDPDLGAWTVHSTAADAERFEIDLFWPAFYYASNSGKIEPADMNIFIQWSPYGENDWQNPPAGVYPGGIGLGGRPYPANEYYATACSKERVLRTTGWTFATPGRYDIRVSRTRQGGTTDQNVRDVTWTAIRSFKAGKPLLDENLSVIVARYKATSTLNGTVSPVSGIVKPLAPKWDGAAWHDAMADWAPAPSAVELMRMMLSGPAAGATALTADQYDASMGEEATASAGREGAVIVQGDAISQEEVMAQLHLLGRYTTYWNGAKLCFVHDGEKPVPTQMFTGRNVANFKYTRNFPDPIHAVMVEFPNTGEDTRGDELVVYADGYSADNATILETYRLPFACDQTRAWKEGRRWLANRSLHSEVFEWDAPLDAVVSTYGDRVTVRHPVTLYGKGEGRVLFRRWSGSLVSGVRLDQPVTLEPGKSYAIDARRSDGAGLKRGLAVTNPATSAPVTTRDLVFGAPLAENAAPLKGDLFAFGEVNIVTEDLEIVDLTPQPDMSVKVKARAYKAADIDAAESGDIPALQTTLTALLDAPQPRLLNATGAPDGVRISWAVALQRQSPIANFRARWRLKNNVADATPGDWHDLPDLAPTANSLRTPAVLDAVAAIGDTDGQVYADVEVRTVLQNGRVSLPLQASDIPIRRSAPAVTTFTATGAVRTAADGSAYPVIAISADAVVAGSAQDLVVEISDHGAGAWISAAQPFPAANPVGDLVGVKSGHAYDVRAKWRTVDGWLSDDYAEEDDVNTPSDSSIAGSALTAPWSGVTDDDGNRPDDNATKNTLTISSSAPSGPTAGDLWADVSTTPTVWKVYSAGAWTNAATVGGTFASNLYESGATLATLANFKTILGTAAAITGQAPAATDSTIQSGATKNTLTYGSSAPTSPGNGDLWGDTSSTPTVWKVYSGGSWQSAATIGGTFATNLYETGSTLATLANFKTALGTAAAITGQQAWATAKITIATTAPSTPATGDIWINSTSTPNVWQRWSGSAWVATTPTNTNQLTDGANLGGTAAWTGVTGTGKPADNATKNTLTYSSTAPTGPTAGTSSTPVVWKVYSSGAWQSAATIGGTFATNLYESGSTLATLANFKTALGVAASIAGQAAAATDSTIQAGATKNTLTYSSTAPTSPGNGDLWCDTTTTPVVWKIRVSGAWQLAASYGAVFGSTLLESSGGAAATLANFKTALGTAAGIAGQGAWATATITYSSSSPGTPATGDVWLDTSTTPAQWKRWSGSAWVSTTPTNTNQLSDGANLGGTAAWSGVTGTGKPADYATKNTVSYASTAPSSPTDGDLWCDTSTTPNVWKLRVSGAWQTGASLGGAFGSTLLETIGGIAATLANFKTALGTAAAITGQAAAATDSTIETGATQNQILTFTTTNDSGTYTYTGGSGVWVDATSLHAGTLKLGGCFYLSLTASWLAPSNTDHLSWRIVTRNHVGGGDQQVITSGSVAANTVPGSLHGVTNYPLIAVSTMIPNPATTAGDKDLVVQFQTSPTSDGSAFGNSAPGTTGNTALGGQFFA